MPACFPVVHELLHSGMQTIQSIGREAFGGRRRPSAEPDRRHQSLSTRSSPATIAITRGETRRSIRIITSFSAHGTRARRQHRVQGPADETHDERPQDGRDTPLHLESRHERRRQHEAGAVHDQVEQAERENRERQRQQGEDRPHGGVDQSDDERRDDERRIGTELDAPHEAGGDVERDGLDGPVDEKRQHVRLPCDPRGRARESNRSAECGSAESPESEFETEVRSANSSAECGVLSRNDASIRGT